MAPQVTFPAHTQARMAAANAVKQRNKPVTPINAPTDVPTNVPTNDQPSTAFKYPTMSGEVNDLCLSARQWILESDAKVAIGCGTVQAFVPLVKNVNLAMLEYYVPYLVANHKYTMPNGDVILLPHDMGLVTLRGLKYVINNMKREMEKGSYAVDHVKKEGKKEEQEQEEQEAAYMIRPCDNPVDMIHALSTLKAFNLAKDAGFLAMKDGPIMTSLERRATKWDGSLRALKRFLDTLGHELLVESDRRLLVPAWVVYTKRLRARADLRAKDSGRKA
ncbi:hypothetical protein DHEL01_v200580 [Diaporthe helianthi]|uniref:Uncharacterized protein n=1 Tax=Diaporthe helianthi TaxID=158607 RepID=A0A2P5IEU1_DIAHE|nr:hypothetical protein DHEL01_v200580 [Diaporthe helianthi]